MGTVRYTLLADGSSDVALMSVIEWIIRVHRPDLRVVGELADVGPVGSSLQKRVLAALSSFPCDILFVHRDAEKGAPDARRQEIAEAAGGLQTPWVAIVPVRMTEAWLLSDVAAIRSAAGNRSGTVDLKLPPKRQWESLPDPKQVLLDALLCATQKSGRARARFHPLQARGLIAPRTGDFSGLRGLESFDLFESQLVTRLQDL